MMIPGGGAEEEVFFFRESYQGSGIVPMWGRPQ